MSKKKITIDLNGGDAVTAHADLKFQILGSATETGTYTAISTANYAALGSKNTAGTDTTVVFTVDGSDPDLYTLDHVDIGSAVWLKYQVQDEAGNESDASAAKEVSDCSQDTGNVWGNQCFTDTDSDGLADDLSKFGNTTATIETGNGHLGNAQKIVGGTNSSEPYINFLSTVAAASTIYDVSFKYRGEPGATAARIVLLGQSSGNIIEMASDVTGNATEITGVWSSSSGGDPAAIRLYLGGHVEGDWVEISDFKMTVQ